MPPTNALPNPFHRLSNAFPSTGGCVKFTHAPIVFSSKKRKVRLAAISRDLKTPIPTQILAEGSHSQFRGAHAPSRVAVGAFADCLHSSNKK